MLLPLLIACGPEPLVDDLGPSTEIPATPVDPDVATWWPGQVPVDSATQAYFFGDSITAGFGIGNDANVYTSLLFENNDELWPDHEGDTLTERYGDLDTYDFSRSGARTSSVLDFQIPQMDAAVPVASGHTLVFMTIAGNDLTGALASGGLDTVVEEIDDNLREIAEVFDDSSRFPDGATLFLTNVYEPTDGEGQADPCFFGLDVSAVEPTLDEINANSLALAQEFGFSWVDLRGHFRGHGHNYANESIEAYHAEDPTLWLQDDCIHPTPRGHHELRRLFLSAVDGAPLPL